MPEFFRSAGFGMFPVLVLGSLAVAAARERLRRAVLEELAASRSSRWRWWERPLALGLAATAALVALSAVRSVSSGPGTAPRTLGQPAADPVEHRAEARLFRRTAPLRCRRTSSPSSPRRG